MANQKLKAAVKRNLKAKDNILKILSLTFLLGILSCRIAPKPAIQPTNTTEDIAVRGIKISVNRNCEINFKNKEGKNQIWKFPANGPCYFAKNHSGSIEIYKDMRKARDSMGMILVHSTEPIKDQDCLGTNAGILLFKDHVIVQNPPYQRYSLCVDEKGAFDQKHYATSLNSILFDKNQNILKY